MGPSMRTTTRSTRRTGSSRATIQSNPAKEPEVAIDASLQSGSDHRKLETCLHAAQQEASRLEIRNRRFILRSSQHNARSLDCVDYLYYLIYDDEYIYINFN